MADDGKSNSELAAAFNRTTNAISTALHKMRHRLPIGPLNRENGQ